LQAPQLLRHTLQQIHGLPSALLLSLNTISGVLSKKPISLFQPIPDLQCRSPVNCCFIGSGLLYNHHTKDFCGLLQKSFIISHAKIRIKSVVRLGAVAFIPGFSFEPLLMKAHSKQKNLLVWVIPKIGADVPHFRIAEFFLFNLIYKEK